MNCFDLCLMKREVFSTDDEQENTLVVYFSQTGNTEKIAALKLHNLLIILTAMTLFILAIRYGEEKLREL